MGSGDSMSGRPLCLLTAAFIAGIAAVVWHLSAPSPSWFIASAAVFLAILSAVIFVASSSSRFLNFGALAFFILGMLTAQLGQPLLPAPTSLTPFLDQADVLLLAEVRRAPDFYLDRVRIPVELMGVMQDGKNFPVEGGALLTIGEPDLKPGSWLVGDRMVARLTLSPFHNFNNPGGYDYVLSQAEQGLYARAYIASQEQLLKLTPTQRSGPAGWLLAIQRRLDGFRQNALFWLREKAQPRISSFYAALLLGYRHQLPKEQLELVNRAGVTHLLAISGLHLGMVAVAVFWLTRWFVRLCFPSVLQKTSDHRFALWIACLCALFYAFIGGLALPTWRASIMLFLAGVAIHQCRQPDPPSLLAAAAMVILLIAPHAIKQVSFQLSFAAMIGIFLIYPRLKIIEAKLAATGSPARKILATLVRPFLSAFLLSLSVLVMALPLTAYHFHGVSWSSLVANTVLTPLVGLVALPMGLLSLALLTVSESAAGVLLKLGGLAIQLCDRLITWFGNLSWGFVWVGTFPWLWLFAFYAAMVILLCAWSTRRKALGFAVLCSVIIAYGLLVEALSSNSRQTLLRVTVIDVGQGSSSLVQFPGGQTMLIDGGGFQDDSFDVGRFVVAPFLWWSGVRKLDYVVLSHDHPDHCNGLRFILAHFHVGQFWQTGLKDQGNSIAIGGPQHPLPRLQLTAPPDPAGSPPIPIGSCSVRVLHPSAAYLERHWNKKDLNDVSLVLRIDYGDTCVIFPGDISAGVESFLFADHGPTGDALLIAPHHGSAGSNSSLLLDRLKPSHIIFSCGYRNGFGFPAAPVLARCQARRVNVHRTDLHGAILAASDGTRWKVEHHLQRNSQPTTSP